jgi:hypothetical protein
VISAAHAAHRIARRETVFQLVQPVFSFFGLEVDDFHDVNSQWF